LRKTQGQAAFGHNVQIKMIDHNLLKYSQNLFQTGTVGRVFSVRVERTYFGAQKATNDFVNYFNFRIIPEELSRSAKQHPSNSAHLMRPFVRDLSIYVKQIFIFADLRA
jgi:hypothetical protein